MRRTASRFFAISSSFLLLGLSVQARTRPRYGDAVRVEMQTSVSDYEPTPDVLAGLVYETLTINDGGTVRPGLASNWWVEDGKHWNFKLRPGVLFHDGSPFFTATAANALAKHPVPGCRVRASVDSIVFDCDRMQLHLDAELTRSEYVIASFAANGTAQGTGPFRVEKREHTRIALRANDDYWGGRPFVDALEIVPGRTVRDQMSDFAFDRADVIEVATDQWRRAQQDRLRLDVSQPAETVYLVIQSSKPELRDVRAAVHNVIFQRQGEVAGGLLPNWLTGYAFLFSAAPDVAKAKQLRSELGPVSPITIGYDVNEPLERLIAERVALNARDAGINLQAVATSTIPADVRLKRVVISSADPAIALDGVVQELNIVPAAGSANIESLYANERAALKTYMAIPLVHLPKITALKDRIHNWTSSPTGTWALDAIWVTPRVGREGRP
jgi:peptide/nickel transport system substrate-binding protein